MAVNETEIEEIGKNVVEEEKDKHEEILDRNDNANEQEVAEERIKRSKGQALTTLREDPVYKGFCSVMNEFTGVSLNEDAILEMCLRIQPIDITQDIDYKLSIDTITQVLAVAKDQISREPNGIVFDPVTGELDEELSEEQRKQVYSLLTDYENKLDPEQRIHASDVLSDALIKESAKEDKKIDFSYINHTYGNMIKDRILSGENYTGEEKSKMIAFYVNSGESNDMIDACRAKSILNGEDEVEFMNTYVELKSLENAVPRDEKAIKQKKAELDALPGAKRFKNQDGSINEAATGEYMDAYVTKENLKTINEFISQENMQEAFREMDYDEQRELLEAIYQVDTEARDTSSMLAMIAIGGIEVEEAYKSGDQKKLDEIFCNLYNSTLDGKHNLTMQEIKEQILVKNKIETVLGHTEHLHSKVLDGTFHDIVISDDLDEKARDKAINEHIKQMKKATKPKLELKREDVSRLITDLGKTIDGKNVTMEELIPSLYTACDSLLKRPIGDDKMRKEVEKSREMLEEVMMSDKGKYGQYIDKDEINTSKIRHDVKRLEVARKMTPELSEEGGRGKWGAYKSIVHTPAMEALLQRAEVQVIREEKPVSIANLRSSVRDIATAVKEFAQERNRARKERKPARAFFKRIRDNLTGNGTKSLPAGETTSQDKTDQTAQNSFDQSVMVNETVQAGVNEAERQGRLSVAIQEAMKKYGISYKAAADIVNGNEQVYGGATKDTEEIKDKTREASSDKTQISDEIGGGR